MLEGLGGGHESIDPFGPTAEELEAADGVLDKLQRDVALTKREESIAEAIILPRGRPVIDVVDGTFAAPSASSPFPHFGANPIRSRIEMALPAIGRIELPGQSQIPFGGTGFLVGDGLLMTNRHVAAIFTEGVGRGDLRFKTGWRAGIDFKREHGSEATHAFSIEEIAMIHPYWDMALLRIRGLEGLTPLVLSTSSDGYGDREIAVVGYPYVDRRNDMALQKRIFRNLFGVKRLQPGLLRGVRDTESFGHTVPALTHDSSTLGGNSGSAVIDVTTGHVVALHFGGRYLDANFGVPTAELARDPHVVDSGVRFESPQEPGPTPWEPFWRAANETSSSSDGGAPTGNTNGAGNGAIRPVARGGGDGMHAGASATWRIPIEITIRVGDAATVSVGGPASEGEFVEKLVEPFHEDDYTTRAGYDDRFLGLRVRMPKVTNLAVVSRLDDGGYALPYEHFSVVMHKLRRLPLFTASNVDAREEMKDPEPGRDTSRKGLSGLSANDQEKWFTDPRIPAEHQLPDKFFTKDRQAFDKGHIVRREDVAWGSTFDELRRANGDTYHVTNCSPQVLGFNRSQSDGLWGKLENEVLKQAKREPYCLFAGPVLAKGDRVFQGFDDAGRVRVKIPSRYWKVVVARDGDELATFAFLLRQDLGDVSWKEEFIVPAAWKKHRISLRDLESLLGTIEFPRELHASDQD